MLIICDSCGTIIDLSKEVAIITSSKNLNPLNQPHDFYLCEACADRLFNSGEL